MRRVLVAVLLAVSATAVLIGAASATPSAGVVSAAFIADGVIDDRVHIQSRAGESTRVRVQELTIAPSATTGWHSHAGPVLVVVESGTFTVRSVHGDACVTTAYGAGSAFVDPGRGFAHEGRNLGDTNVVLTATYLLPVGGETRIDVRSAPESCAG